MTVRAALRLIAVSGPLRRVAVATALTAASFGALSVIAVLLGEELSGRSGAGASLVAAFGLGNLAGSGLVTAFPLRGEPERLATRLVVVMAVALALCALVPSSGFALAAFALAGASNAPFFTATLAARSRYSPERARAQVFVSMAGLKVAAASAGTALARAASAAGAAPAVPAGARGGGGVRLQGGAEGGGGVRRAGARRSRERRRPARAPRRGRGAHPLRRRRHDARPAHHGRGAGVGAARRPAA